MIKKVAAYMKQYHMVQEGDHVSVGVSGGADSVCLFLVLKRLCADLGFTMSVVHIEHGIRGEESIEDLLFARRLAEQYGIPFTSYAYPVEKIAKEQGLSVEEAGRNVRYESFEREREKWEEEAKRRGGTVRTAVAHHADDNAETVLFHLCRGSGMEGLAGIRPVRGPIIRPLLGVSRKEIEAFLASEGQEYRVDATNAELIYSRNRIRSRVMPELSCVNEKALLHINRAAEDFAELSDYIRMQVQKVLAEAVTKKGNGEIYCALDLWQQYPAVIKKRAMMELIALSAESRKDITREHVGALLDIAEGQVGRRINLPRGWVGEKTYGAIHLFLEKEKGTDGRKIFAKLLTEQNASGVRREIVTPYGKIWYKIFKNDKNYEEIPKKKYTKWLDYDRIKNGLYFRTREPGDYFSVDGKGHKQKLKDYFINEKVPKELRDQIVLVAEGHHILWAAGFRISEYYKVSEDTRRILEVQFMEGKV